MTTDWWRCTVCGYIYKPEIGDSVAKVKVGTPFENLPAEWVCPVCFTEKADFVPFTHEEEN